MDTTERPQLRAKIQPPPLRDRQRPRSRVTQLISGQLERHQILLVTATAGSGKTTAVLHASEAMPQSCAWLTLDRLDVSPGRLLSYLEASLLRVDASLPPTATYAMSSGVGHTESAALLAEGLGQYPIAVVIDELERIADSEASIEVIANFARYLPDECKLVLISRRDIPLDLARQELSGVVGRFGEADLAVRVNEARELLRDLDRPEGDVESAVAATAGWMTGLLFESWRSERHVHGTGGEVDPLRTYLSSEIMAGLPEGAQRFLILTSVLDDVSAQRARALGLEDSARVLGLLRDLHLPVTFSDANSFRCHPRFREYLLERFEGLEQPVVREIRVRHADLLVEEGREEEAVDEYLRSGDIAQAEDTSVEVLLSVVRRLDIELVRRWLAAFRRWRIESSAIMTEAELLAALEREEYGLGVKCADQLLRIAADDPSQPIESDLFGAMAWCYFLHGRIEDAESVLADAPAGPQTNVMRFAIGVELLDSPTHYRDRPSDANTMTDGMLARIDLAHGRFEQVLHSHATRYDAIRDAQLGALTGLGRLEEALEHLAGGGPEFGWTHVRMTAELLAEVGRPDEAWSTLIRGRELLAMTDSTLFRMFASLTEAMLALRFSRDTALASAVLDMVEREPTALRRVRVVEQLALWRGLLALIDGRDNDAVGHLRDAVHIMTEWDRLLFLPTAAVYLAEAEWRTGEDDASDAAADLALVSADRTGSRHSLIRALREYPAVLSRRLDTETDPDSDWHDLGRAVITTASKSPALVCARITGFGEPALLVGARRHRLKLVKSAELLAFLAWRGGQTSREDVIANLFDSKNDRAESAYLRMAVNGVRSLFPDEDCLQVGAETVAWVRGDLQSDFTELHTRLIRLRNVQGRQRLSLAMAALTAIPEGEYMSAWRSEWAVDQRRRWNELILDVRQAAAEAAFDVAGLATARLLIEPVLEADPYRERAWRLLMRIAGAVGDGDGVIAAYRTCASALASIDTIPTESTRKLLHRLRF